MPGRGAPPGRGACGCGRGMARSTGCAEENGLLPTRGGRGAPGLGPGVAGRGPGAGGAAGAGTAAAGGGVSATGAAGAAGAAGLAGAGAAGLGASPLPVAAGAAGFAGPGVAAGAGAAALGAAGAAGASACGAGLPPPKDSRSRRATGASTVEDADLTNSPCSLRRARTSLLVTPSSLANSCTRAFATTSPVYEATAVVGRASGLAMTHCHRDFTVCSCSSLPVLLTGVVELVFQSLEVLLHPGYIRRTADPQRPHESPSPNRRVQALRCGMQPCPPPRLVARLVNDHGAIAVLG